MVIEVCTMLNVVCIVVLQAVVLQQTLISMDIPGVEQITDVIQTLTQRIVEAQSPPKRGIKAHKVSVLHINSSNYKPSLNCDIDLALRLHIVHGDCGDQTRGFRVRIQPDTNLPKTVKKQINLYQGFS